MPVVPASGFGNMVDKRALESSVKNFALMLHERIHAIGFEFSHGTGAEINHLFVLVGHSLLNNPLAY